MAATFRAMSNCDASFEDKKKIVEKYLKIKGSSINRKEDTTGNTFLHYAYMCKDDKFIEFLIEKRINENITNKDGALAKDLKDLATYQTKKKAIADEAMKRQKLEQIINNARVPDVKKLDAFHTYMSTNILPISTYLKMGNSSINSDIEIINEYLTKYKDTSIDKSYNDLLYILINHFRYNWNRSMNNKILSIIELVLQSVTNINHKVVSTSPIHNGLTPLMIASHYTDELGIQLVTYLYEKGAKINLKDSNGLTALDYAIKANNADIIQFLESKDLWKGSTKSDFTLYDTFFEEPKEYSNCPICLMYIRREDGCMYMSHDCSKTGRIYYTELYNLLHTNRLIEWCTYCGRICKSHKHINLALHDVRNGFMYAPIVPAVGHRFFDSDCINSGGGGVVEKVNRMRAVRKRALELEKQINKISKPKAIRSLIEASWDAPSVTPYVKRSFIEKYITHTLADPSEKVLKNKQWNIPLNTLPEKLANNNSNIVENVRNIVMPNTRLLPINKGKGNNCVIYSSEAEDTEENPLYQFQHQDEDANGGVDHDNLLICKDDIITYMDGMSKNFTLDNFGKCIVYPQCKAKLYPEEIKDIVPEDIYTTYKTNFNKKFTVGGYNGNNSNNSEEHYSVFAEIQPSNASCGRYTRKNNNRKNNLTRKN